MTRESNRYPRTRNRHLSQGAVRTRGFIPLPQASVEEMGIGAVRTRGPIRANWEEATKVQDWQELRPEEVGGLLDAIRERQEYYPLVIVVDNPQATAAKSFLKCIWNECLLDNEDVLWVLGEGSYDSLPEDLHNVVPNDDYLNVEEEKQEAVVISLVPDLVFIADDDPVKLKDRAKKWEHRVWAVVLGCPDSFDCSTLANPALGFPGKKGNIWRRRWLS